MILGKLAIGAVGMVVAGGALVCSEGFVHVRVHEKQPGGTSINIIAPMAIGEGALYCVPKEHLRDAAGEIRPWLPTIEAALNSMQDLPDMTFVEVTDGDQHVLVSKSGGNIVVDVNDDDDTVHVSTPLRGTRHAIEEIAAAGQKI